MRIIKPISSLDWKNCKDELPKKPGRVLVYSSQHINVSPILVYRLMDAGYVKLTTDAEQWAYLVEEKGETDGGN